MITTNVDATSQSASPSLRPEVAWDYLSKHLRAVVQLAGAVRPNRLMQTVDRSLLDLPLTQDRNLFEDWMGHVGALTRQLGREQLAVRVMVNRQTPPPHLSNHDPRLDLTIEYDPYEYRGTAGLLHDISRNYEADDLLLVIGGAAMLLEPLHEVLARIVDPDADAAVLSHADGTPSCLMLLRCRALNGVKSSGFLDLKEQFLPELSSVMRVKAVERTRPTTLPIRTLGSYVSALRLLHRGAGVVDDINPYMEHWQPSFALAEDGASLAADARLHDSVVLAGGRVESGATVVNCVVGPRGLVRRNARVVNQLVGGSGRSGRNGGQT